MVVDLITNDMKKYNVKNYIRYKDDVKQAQPPGKFYDEYTRDELIVKFLPLVENIARKFATSQEASGVLSIMDLIQEGSAGLIFAVDNLHWDKLEESDDIEKSLKSFFSKRIKGAIRRKIDELSKGIRLPEYKINEIRKDGGKNRALVELFFNSTFLSLDDVTINFKTTNNPTLGANNKDGPFCNQIPDNDSQNSYNEQMFNAYLITLVKQYLNEAEYEVLRLSYGLDCRKHSANEIAEKLNISGVSAYVRVSELKKQAVEKLIDKVDYSQVIDYL